MAHCKKIRCESGEMIGEQCEWTGPTSATSLIEVMPEYLRASHAAAGYSGEYPSNGAERYRVCPTCAAVILSDCDDAWVRCIGEPAARELGRRGGLAGKGSAARRAAAITAARARWASR